MEKSKIRLQKLLSTQGLYSRRKVEELITAKKIIVNNKLARLGDRASTDDIIKINGQLITFRNKINQIVLAFYKPLGVESSLATLDGVKTLVDFDFMGKRVFPIGRLDKNSQGLLLLTNNGDLCNELAHPTFAHEKEYLVSLDRQMSEKDIQSWRDGILLNGQKTQKCIIEKMENNPLSKFSFVLRVILKEGKNRQIRRICDILGYKIVDLLRTRVGKITLGELKIGKFRFVQPLELGLDTFK